MLAASFAPIGVPGLQAAGLPTGGVSASGTINQTSATTVTTSPSSAAPGESFGVSGSGFTPGDTVTIEFGGDTIGTAKVDANGNFSTTATVPTHMPEGGHPLDVNGMTGVSKDLNYTVTAPPPPAPTPTPAPYYYPRVSSGPSSAPPGGTVTFTGTGFRPGEWVTISFGGSDIALGHADGLGEFTTTGTIPADMPMGDHPLDANGDLGSSWDGELGVDAPLSPPPAPMTPKVGMAPGSAEPGEYVLFTGSDFYAGEYVSIDFGGSTIAQATADASGAFSASGTIAMSMPVGTRPLDVNGDMGSSWDGDLTVLAISAPAPTPTPAPTQPATTQPATTQPATTQPATTQPASSATVQVRVGVTPSSAAAGEQLTIIGQGFKPGERISVELGGGSIATATADAAGQFRTTGRIPAEMPAGAHPMEVNGDQGTSVEGAFTVKPSSLSTEPATTEPTTTQPATTQPATTQPVAAASNETTTSSETSEANSGTAATADGGSDETTEIAGSESSSTLAGPEPAEQAFSELPASSKVSNSEAVESSKGDDADSARTRSGDAAGSAAANANQGSSSQLTLALIAMAGAMPVLAGTGWLLGTRRARHAAAPQHRIG